MLFNYKMDSQSIKLLYNYDNKTKILNTSNKNIVGILNLNHFKELE